MGESASTNTVMPVQPMAGLPFGGGYGGGFGGYGGDGGWWWIILLFIICGGWGNGNGWGGNGGGNGAFPWLLDANRNTRDAVTAGFDNAALTAQLSGIQSSISSGFSTAEVAACGRAMNQMQTDYNNQIATLNRSFDSQTAITAGMTALQAQLAQCCCDNRLAVCQTNNTIQSEAAANRYASANNTRDIIENQTRGTQAILDKLCQLELDGMKSNLAAAQRENDNLRTTVLMKDLAASQAEQTSILRTAAQTANANLLSELRSCPIPAQPVYGSQPIFTCSGNGGCGCSGNNGFGRVGFGNGTF